MRNIALFLFSLFFANPIYGAGEFKPGPGGMISSGPVSIGTVSTPDSKAVLDVTSTTKGLLPPRLTTTQRDAIVSPTAGLFIFNSTTSKHSGYSGSSWLEFGEVIGQGSSVDSEIALFSGVGGKTIKRASGTGLVSVSSGVYQTPSALTGDVTTSGAGFATTAAATQANIVTLSKSTGVTVHGTNTNDNAAAGFAGEYFEDLISSSTNFPATATWGDAVSRTLTAGDWEITLFVTSTPNGATATKWSIGVSTTSGNSGTGLVSGQNEADGPAPNATSSQSLVIASYRASLSASTTYYGKILHVYSAGGPPQYTCRMSFRRMR